MGQPVLALPVWDDPARGIDFVNRLGQWCLEGVQFSFISWQAPGGGTHYVYLSGSIAAHKGLFERKCPYARVCFSQNRPILCYRIN